MLSAVMQSVIMQSVAILSVIILNVIILNVVILSVVMRVVTLIVVAPWQVQIVSLPLAVLADKYRRRKRSLKPSLLPSYIFYFLLKT